MIGSALTSQSRVYSARIVSRTVEDASPADQVRYTAVSDFTGGQGVSVNDAVPINRGIDPALSQVLLSPAPVGSPALIQVIDGQPFLWVSGEFIVYQECSA